MKKNQERALNAFAAMESLPESMVLEAENALIAAEGGVIVPVKKPKGGFARFLNSGWGAAVISGIVALGVLLFIIRAGREAPVYEPPIKPVGSTIEMSQEGANFTISTEQPSYDEGVVSITAVMTGKEQGQTIFMGGGWHLERITEDGCEMIPISYTEEATESAKPGRNEYATIRKTVHIEKAPLTAGRYRLHATKHDGEKYVSVAYCTFTVGNPDGNTEGNTETPPTASFELVFPGFRISLPENAYLYDRPNDLIVNRGLEDPGPPEHITDESLPATRTLTVDGKEYTLTYLYTQSRNSPTDTDYYTYTQPGHADGEWSILAIYPHGSDQLAEVNYRCRDGFLLNGLPTTQAEAQTVADARVKELMGSLPRSSDYRYDADSNRHTVIYHSTSSLINTAGASIYKLSNADIVQIRISLSRFDEAQIHADIGNLNVSLLTTSLEDFLTRYYKDSSITFEGLEEGVSATQGPCIHYTATITAEGRRQSISVQVYRSGPQTDDPDKQLISGTFLWVDGDPMLWDGGKYLPTHLLATEGVSFDGLTTGDHIEVIVGTIHETAPPTAYAYKIAAHVVGVEKAGLTEYVAWLTEMGYTVTDTKK